MTRKLCICPCQRPLPNGKPTHAVYFENSCAFQYKKLATQYGMFHIDEIVFLKCKACGEDFISKKGTNLPATCVMFSGSKECETIAKGMSGRSKKPYERKAREPYETAPCKAVPRAKHIVDYCLEPNECDRYSDCMGRAENYTGKCYVKPVLTSGYQSFGVCSIINARVRGW